MTRKLYSALFLTGTVALSGCAVSPVEQALFSRHADNAEAFSTAADLDPELKPVYKQWLRDDAASWRAVSNWSLGKGAATPSSTAVPTTENH